MVEVDEARVYPRARRFEHLEAFEADTGWTELVRTPSPRNPAQKKTRVFIKHAASGAEVHILCRSDGRRDGAKRSGDP